MVHYTVNYKKHFPASPSFFSTQCQEYGTISLPSALFTEIGTACRVLGSLQESTVVRLAAFLLRDFRLELNVVRVCAEFLACAVTEGVLGVS